MTKRKVGNLIGGLQDKSTQQTWVARQYRSPASLENCHVKKNSQAFQIPYKNAKTTICQMVQGFETHLVFFKIRTKISHPYPSWPSATAAAGTGFKPLVSSTDSIAARGKTAEAPTAASGSLKIYEENLIWSDFSHVYSSQKSSCPWGRVVCKDPKGRQHKFKSIFLIFGVCWRMTFGERFCDHVELAALMLGIHSGTRGVMTEGWILVAFIFAYI